MKGLRYFLIIPALFTMTSVPVFAQEEAQGADSETPVARQEDTSKPQVFINDRLIMTIREGAASLTPEQRADTVRKRLGPILTMPNLRAEDIEVRQERKYHSAGIYVRDRLLITVDRGLAKANNTVPKILAEQWAQNLRETLPQVNVGVHTNVGPQVVINDRIIMSIPTGADGLTPAERANVVRLRLGPILTMPDLEAEDITVKQRQSGQTAAIYVRNRILISIDRTLAEAHKSTPAGLAQKWAGNLREVLPEIKVAVRNSGASEGYPQIK